MPERSIMHGQAARAALMHGMDLMAGLLRPTLGPAARTVAIARIVGSDPPKALASTATIARRTIQFANLYEFMGAVLLRHLASYAAHRHSAQGRIPVRGLDRPSGDRRRAVED